MILSLTGFMGCGKSSVGRRLSQLLCCPFMDLDDVIVESAGRSIPEIFASEGEAGFRRMELEALKEMVPKYSRGPLPNLLPQAVRCKGPLDHLQTAHEGGKMPLPYNRHTSMEAQSPTLILALGGGTVMTPECAEIVKEQTFCIYLKASIETLMEHLSGEADGRPMLANTSSADNSTSLRGAERRGNPLYDRIAELMAQRSETYEKNAHIIIDTDGKSIEAIASEIISISDHTSSSRS